MFAFAFLDARERTLLLARDFLGIKPLYHARWRGGLAFASEILPLVELPGTSRAANPQRLYDFLRFGITDHSDETCFAAVSQLPAGHYAELSLDGALEVAPRPFWRLDTDARLDISFEEAAARLRELFLDNIRLHVRSDVPVGTALSGGIDSSAIVMAMRALAGDALELHTFSYVPGEAPELGEERWIETVRRAAGAIGHDTRPAAPELLPDVDRLIEVYEEPFEAMRPLVKLRVARLTREAGVKVVLNGQGADEILGGYPTHLSARLAALVRRGRVVEAARFTRQATRHRRVPLRELVRGGPRAPAPAPCRSEAARGKPARAVVARRVVAGRAGRRSRLAPGGGRT
jgi:asparagine synthase (glutamine-hydrolysing)